MVPHMASQISSIKGGCLLVLEDRMINSAIQHNQLGYDANQRLHEIWKKKEEVLDAYFKVIHQVYPNESRRKVVLPVQHFIDIQNMISKFKALMKPTTEAIGSLSAKDMSSQQIGDVCGKLEKDIEECRMVLEELKAYVSQMNTE